MVCLVKDFFLLAFLSKDFPNLTLQYNPNLDLDVISPLARDVQSCPKRTTILQSLGPALQPVNQGLLFSNFQAGVLEQTEAKKQEWTPLPWTSATP